jgi:hypothetical protein
MYNATSSLVRFENKLIFFCFERTLHPTTGVVVVNSKVGLAPALILHTSIFLISHSLSELHALVF